MRENKKITLNNIMIHKEHFDQKLIKINSIFQNRITKLTSSNAKLMSRNQNYKKLNFDLRVKIKDVESQKYTTNKKYLEVKNEHDEIMEYLKNIQKEIDKLKIENEQQRKEINKQEKRLRNRIPLFKSCDIQIYRLPQIYLVVQNQKFKQIPGNKTRIIPINDE